MRRRIFDDVIVGQGLAGTTLAWQLRHRGRSVLVIDRDATISSSGVAAGLMTPVTGRRLARCWRWEELWPLACRFYERVQQETGTEFLTRTAMVRILTDADERDLFESRRGELSTLVGDRDPAVDATCFHLRHGAFEMPDGGYLNVPAYLRASRSCFIDEGRYLTSRIDPGSDIELTDDGVVLPRLGISAAQLTWCQGVEGIENPEFASITFQPAKGEILRLSIPGLTERRVVHGGVWLLPLGNAQFLCGATYDFDATDNVPTMAGREEISERLRGFLRVSFEVLGQAGGIRPALSDVRPVIGVHPRSGQLATFNGLGSKGALYAPGFAGQLVRCFIDHEDIEQEVSYQRWTRSPEISTQPPRLTEQAHRMVRLRLRAGDRVVDATAGNGRDTAFLAATVGPRGKVIAFDIQQTALERTADRLRKLGIRNVELVRGDHAALAEMLPTEWRGCIGAVMFNLGYLPGGDRAIITQTKSTILAVQSALNILRTGGIVTVVAYPGHGGGTAETAAVDELLSQLPARTWEVGVPQPHDGQSVPRLYWAIRRD